MPFEEKVIDKFLKTYPAALQRFLRGSLVILREERFIKNERIDGSYDLETGEIILWSPQEGNEEDLFVILTHEWGHKIYHEWLSNQQRVDWLRVRSKEKIDFGLDKVYPATKLPEEEYCTIFTLVSKKLYWRKTGMKTQSKKLSKRINKEFPLAAAVVGSHIKKSAKSQRNSGDLDRRHITHREVEAIKAWIRQAIS